MITVTDRRRRGRLWHRQRVIRLDAATALLLGRAVWRMYRGRAPWTRRHRPTAWMLHR